MPWSAAIAAAGTIGGALLSGNGAPSSPGNVNVYQPTGTGAADTQLQGLNTANTNLVGANNPYNAYSTQFNQLYNQQFNNPYQAGAQTSANAAGAGYTGVGNNALMNSTALSGGVNPLLSGAASTLNMGIDPQQALYNQQLQQTTDQANVNNARYGLTGQQAAGSVNQADTNFNIDWQNNELSRAISSLNAAGTATTAAGGAGTTAANVGSAGAGAVNQGGTTPYQQNILGTSNQSTALNDYIASLLGPQTSSQQVIGDLQTYLNTGINASTAGQSASLADYNAQLAGASGGATAGASLADSITGINGFNFSNSNTTALPWQAPGYVNPPAA